MKKIRKDANIESRPLEHDSKDISASTNSLHSIVDKNILDSNSTTTDSYQTPDFNCGGDYQQDDNEEDGNIYANDVLNFGSNSNPSPAVFKEPPPLPPKPKNIAWRLSNGINYNFDSNSKSIYLDHPTSSFV